jgi:hypothetical protein
MKKRKTFKDGLLTFDVEARKLTLYDDCHKVIDTEHASTSRNVSPHGIAMHPPPRPPRDSKQMCVWSWHVYH